MFCNLGKFGQAVARLSNQEKRKLSLPAASRPSILHFQIAPWTGSLDDTNK